ncbi:protein phosphatase 2C domain-containing protein [Haloplanus salilacus]|uniref:protein phosphatase 2C domain-containing protein n=1 Tax=Haloplanus salilacus TaxID=2949994 RepID=UPI0030D29444
MSDDAPRRSKVVGCSVRGPKHEETDEPCQDAWCGYRLSGGRFVIAVGDGLGSASHSHEGSELATREAADALRRYLSDAETIEREACGEAMKNAMAEARAAVEEEAVKLDQSASELNTTLLTVAAGPSGMGAAVVGDGGIVSHHQGTNDLPIPREMTVVDTEFANVTVPLMHDSWEESYRFGYQDEFDAVAVFSDGIDEFVWDGRDDVKDAFFDQIFDLVRSTDDMTDVQQELCEYLDNEHHRTYSGDDKTLAIGALSSDVTEDGTGTETVRDVMGSGERSADDFEGETVESDDGEHLPLDATLATGPGGHVYRVVEAETDAVKILPPERRSGGQAEAKIRAMIERPPTERQSFAWPTAVVTTPDGGEFLGYRLSYPDVDDPSNVLEWAASRGGIRRAARPSTVVGRLLDAVGLLDDRDGAVRGGPAAELVTAVDSLHQQGHAVGNLTHDRILVDDGDLFLTGCDEFHIEGSDGTYDGDDALSRYAQPEGCEGLEAVQRADRFGLGVHVFQLLTGGHHPFEARGSEAADGGFGELIRKNPFPYRDPQPELLEPPSDAAPYSALPTDLRRRFERCFVEGKTHPRLRPSASAWVEALPDATSET